jgi:putative nucleotidyltransferase with HDIG domain
MYRNKLIESQSMRNQTIKVIIKTLNEANPREKIHAEKVSQLSRSIGEVLNLDVEVLKELEIAGLLHDIGKIALNENVLNKPDKLTEMEYEQIKRHPEIGYQILKSVDVYTKLADYVLSHHERWDGKGYPRGLSALEIPFIARIISVEDTLEAMIGERPYRETMSMDQAIEELKRNAGTQLDPSIVEAVVNHHWMEDLRREMKTDEP